MCVYIHKHTRLCGIISKNNTESFLELWIIQYTVRLGGCFTPPLMVSQGGKPVGVNYTMKWGNVTRALLDAHERHLRLRSPFQQAFMPVMRSIVTGNKLLQMNRPVLSRPNKNDHLILLAASIMTDRSAHECKSTFCWTFPLQRRGAYVLVSRCQHTPSPPYKARRESKATHWRKNIFL